jgi:peptidoglycan/xylan/chitin deacetylase (PgdA/CDA1 family)
MSVKASFRNRAAQLLFLSGLTAPERRSRARFSVVTFHRVLEAAERDACPYPGLVVTPQELDACLTYFSLHFDCGALAIQHRRYLTGVLPARPLLALTFDDAQHDNYRNARPLLARHRMSASFFAPVVAVQQQELLWHDRLGFAMLAVLKHAKDGRERLKRILAAAGLSGYGRRGLVENVAQESKQLTADARLRLVETLVEASGNAPAPDFARPMTFSELAELAADGHEIGSHSMTHCLMPECGDGALDHELSESRRVLEQRLALPVESFCYPNGNCDVRTANAVAKAGYRRAVTTRWGSNARESDRFQLRRYDMNAEYLRDSGGDFMPALVAFRMSGFYPGLG